MHKIFKMEWEDESSGIILKERAREATCVWSTKNLVAFTTGFVEAFEDDPCSSLILVHILCPEYPWEVYHIDTGLQEPIEHLMWDRTSTKLLVIDECGVCKIFAMDKHMVNCWKCVHYIDIGSRIVCASWLDTEPKYTYDAKSAYSNILEKFPRKFNKPPLADIAGLCKEGFIAVTEIGLVQVVLCQNGELRGKVSKCKLFTNRSRVLLGDICFKEDGKVHIVLSTDQRVVEFFVLTLRLQIAKVEISFEISPCISPHTMSNEEYPTYQIKCVKFSNEGNVDHILICTESVAVMCLKYFELKIQKANLQPVLQRMVQNPKQINVKEWTCLKSFSFPGKITCFSLSGVLATGFGSNEAMVSPSILLTTAEGTMHRLASGSFSEIGKMNINEDSSETISALTFSPSDICIFAVTNEGNANLFLAASLENSSEAMAVKMTINLFQYCIATGQTSWDVGLLCASQGDQFAEQCQLLLKNEMSNQTAMVKERTFAVQANVQAEIYKGLKSAYFGVIECRDSILLKSIWNYLQSAINLASSEKELQMMAKIKALCSRQLDLELPKLVQLLEAKDIVFNGPLIASSQHMIEWVSSYAVRICRKLLAAENSSNSKQIISTLGIPGLKILREFLVLLFVWGQALPGWQPHFLESGNPLELLAQIFKIVSKMCIRFMQGDYSRDIISIDEIPMRSHPFMYQNIPLFDPKCGVISQFLANTNDVIAIDSERETIAVATKYFHPSPLMQTTEIYANRQSDFFYDGINLIRTMLMKGESLKQCIQCSCLTLDKVNPSRTLLNSWKEQWQESCICGGLWRSLVAKQKLEIKEDPATEI